MHDETLFDEAERLIAMSRDLANESREARRRAVTSVARARDVISRCREAAHARDAERVVAEAAK